MKEDNGFNAEMPVNADLNAIQLEMALQSEAIHSKGSSSKCGRTATKQTVFDSRLNKRMLHFRLFLTLLTLAWDFQKGKQKDKVSCLYLVHFVNIPNRFQREVKVESAGNVVVNHDL